MKVPASYKLQKEIELSMVFVQIYIYIYGIGKCGDIWGKG